MQDLEPFGLSPDFEAFIKNAGLTAPSVDCETQIMNRIRKFESDKKKNLKNLRLGICFLLIATLLGMVLPSLEEAHPQISIASPMLLEVICILSFLFLLDKLILIIKKPSRNLIH